MQRNRVVTKEEILREIKRTAEVNNGAPLGRNRFAAETGIKETDWSGKYWTKWSDAIIEAGYQPNILQGALPLEQILGSLAELVAELGHFPTISEIRLKSRSSSEFPSHNVFNRLGNKSQRIRRLLEFCKSNVEFSHLSGLLESEVSAEPEPEQSENTNEVTGYVYLMQFGSEYKIGTSNNVERRFRELKTQMPYEGKIIHTIATGDPEGIEAYWHGFFAGRRLKGEWFSLSKSDIAYFKKRKLM